MRHRKGYSLVEVLVALALFTVAIFPIMALYPSISRNNSAAEDSQEAARVGSQVVEFIKAKGYRNITRTGTSPAQFIINTADLTTTGNFHLVDRKTFTSTAGGMYTVDDLSSGLNMPGQILIRGRSGFISRATLDVALRNTRVFLRNDGPPVTTAGIEIYRNFIIGRVSVGWDATTTAAVSNTGRIKEINLQFVITPLE